MHTLRMFPVQKLVLDDVDWKTYGRALLTFGGRPSVRLTYDRGRLEIMSPKHQHDSVSRFLCRLVITLTKELKIGVKAGGSTTFRRRKKKRGLEPDECFWIASEPKVRGKKEIDMRVDPPPDLAIEIDITHSSLDRMAIYSDLGVPEVWRLDENGLTFNVLQPNGRYAQHQNSHAFPLLTPSDLVRFLGLCGQEEENAVEEQFIQWVRQKTRPPSAP